MKNNLIILVLFFISATGYSQSSITAEEAINHIGKNVTVCGLVSSGRYLESSMTKPTLLNIGGDFPNHLLTIMIRDEDRKNFEYKPEQKLVSKNACFTGTIIDYKGKPEIIVSLPSSISIANEIAGSDKNSSIEKTAAVNNPPKVAPPIKKEQPTAVASKADLPSYAVELTSDVNMREGPSTEDKVVAVVKKGTLVNIYKSGNGWSHVSIKKEGDNEEGLLHGFIKNSVLK